MWNCNTILPSKVVLMNRDYNIKALIQYVCEIYISNPHLVLIGDDCVYLHEEASVKIMLPKVTRSAEQEYLIISSR